MIGIASILENLDDDLTPRTIDGKQISENTKTLLNVVANKINDLIVHINSKRDDNKIPETAYIQIRFDNENKSAEEVKDHTTQNIGGSDESEKQNIELNLFTAEIVKMRSEKPKEITKVPQEKPKKIAIRHKKRLTQAQLNEMNNVKRRAELIEIENEDE